MTKKLNIVLIIVVVVLALLLIYKETKVYINNPNNNLETNKSEEKQDTISQKETMQISQEVMPKQEIETNNVIETDKLPGSGLSNDTIINDSVSKEVIKEEVIIENTQLEASKFSEEDVVIYFSNMYDRVSNSNTLSNFKDISKNAFIEIVDFIFYEGTIKGYTFSDITLKTKTKIIEVALKLDTFVEDKFPNYKEEITTSTTKLYDKVKPKLVSSYLELISKACANNQDLCDDLKQNFEVIKKSCNIGWDIVKDVASTSKEKLKEWYEIFRSKE